MGSNHCKNIYFINNELASFDAHCGAQNVTIIGCRLEHINCIGEGTIHIEDTTVFAQYQGVAVNLRSDYGSIWMGDAIFKNVELRVLDRTKVALFNASWVNHYFGYTACMPHTVTLDNVYATSDHGLKINTIYLTLSDLTAKGDISADILPDGTKNLNPYNVTQKIIVKNNVKNMKISCYDNLAPYHKTEIIYEDD